MPTPIAANIIISWPSTVVSIPTNWSRETALDAYHIRGSANGVNPGGTGGANAHTHTTTAHTHTETTHTHTVPNSGAASTTSACDGGAVNVALSTHVHNSNANTGTATGAISNATPDTSSDNNEPPYITTLWLKSNGSALGLPPNCYIWWNKAVAPPGWAFADGSGGTIDCRNKYFKGAAGAADGGGTGGTTTHVHNIAAHNHGNWAHGHTSSVSVVASTSGTVGAVSGAARTPSTYQHTHAISVTSATATLAVNTNGNSGTSSNDPPYVNIAVVKNISGQNNTPAGAICIWIGTLANIPLPWILCDGTRGTPDMRTKFAKNPNTLSGIGGTGGSLTSSHTSANHDMSVASHLHTLTPAGGGSSAVGITGGTATTASNGNNTYANDHPHASWAAAGFNSGNATGTTSSTAVTINDNTAVQPLYYDVAFVQYPYIPRAGMVFHQNPGVV